VVLAMESAAVKETLVHRTSVGDVLLLILALCFHSIFEGIAIGVAGLFRDRIDLCPRTLLFSYQASEATGSGQEDTEPRVG